MIWRIFWSILRIVLPVTTSLLLFIVHKAMQQLDEKQEDTVLDFKELLEEDIRKSRRYIRRKKFHRAVVAIAFCALIAVLVVFLFCDPGTEGGNLILSEKKYY